VQNKINPHAGLDKNRVFMQKHLNLDGGDLENQINPLNPMQIIFPKIYIEKILFVCQNQTNPTLIVTSAMGP